MPRGDPTAARRYIITTYVDLRVKRGLRGDRDIRQDGSLTSTQQTSSRGVREQSRMPACHNNESRELDARPVHRRARWLPHRKSSSRPTSFPRLPRYRTGEIAINRTSARRVCRPLPAYSPGPARFTLPASARTPLKVPSPDGAARSRGGRGEILAELAATAALLTGPDKFGPFPRLRSPLAVAVWRKRQDHRGE